MDSYFHLMVDKAQRPIPEQTDAELRHNIAQIQRKWYERKGTSDEHKQFDALLDEILKRRKERQR